MQHDVRRLHISVYNASAVRFTESGRNLLRVAKGFCDRQFASGQSCREALAVDELHDEVINTVMAADVVDGADVGVIKRGDGTRLAFHPLAGNWIGGRAHRKYLDRHRPSESRVTSLVHFAHSAGTDAREDLVRADAPPVESGRHRDVVGRERRWRFETIFGRFHRRDERQHFAAQGLVVRAGARDARDPLGGRSRPRVHRHGLDLFPVLRPRLDRVFFHSVPLVSARCSQPFATTHSRLTVAGDTPIASAASSTVRPPKKRSSTKRP